MTQTATALTEVIGLRRVLHAMDDWEATGGDLTSADGRRRFVDGLDADTADELTGLALAHLAHVVSAEKAKTTKPVVSSGDRQATPDTVSVPRQGHRPAAPALSVSP